ncbi:MAG: CDP-alcohol phosphatidyltransferase family protein [Planctomycetia bacterium]|nr:CDP-alcohol phosphatidyltransferase family protein [Planctomycetia bacterium]
MAESNYQPADRRPIAARETRWANRTADWLARRGASANFISVLGLLAGCAAGACLAATNQLDDWPQRAAWLVGALCVQLRLVANLLDGMVALASGQASRIGELFNDVPDRFADAAICIGLGYSAGGRPDLGYLAACAALLTAYVRVLGKAAGAGSDFSGPMAKQQRMFLVTVTGVFLGLTPTDWQTAVPLPALVLGVIAVGSLLTALRRLLRIGRTLQSTGS